MQRFNAIAAWLQGWLRWTVVTAVGWSLAYLLALAIAQLTGLLFPTSMGLVAGTLLGGLLLGGLQWHFLSPPSENMWRWTVVTAVGWTLTLLAIALISRPLGLGLGLIPTAFLGGIVFAAVQQLALEPPSTHEVRYWWLTTIAGWTAAGAVGATMRTAAEQDLVAQFNTAALTINAGLAIIATIGVFALVVLFPHRPPSGWWRQR